MLMTTLKSRDAIAALVEGKVFIINCHGCKEVGFPEAAAAELEGGLRAAGLVTGVMTTDYICNPENLKLRVKAYLPQIAEADTILVLSCGVGVQTVAEMFDDKKVCAACDTYKLPGFQGVTTLDVACDQCGECFLTMTAGICPITACSKSLVNGPCGGTKKGKCEVDPTMDCGWERIYRRLEAQGRLDVFKCPTNLKDYSTVKATAECKQSE